MTGLTVLAVDDELPALDELSYLLNQHDSIATVHKASDATEALRVLSEHTIEAAFLDISMPGLSGMELAGVLANYTRPPAIVFVTAHDDRAVEAFDVGALDYLLKPLRTERLNQAIDRILAARAGDNAATETAETAAPPADDVIPVELGGVTSLVRRDAISWIEAVGDYARLHTDSGAHLVRVTLSTLESRWRSAGFARVHRSYLVSLPMVNGLRSTGASTMVRVRANGASPAVELPVSRRQVRELKDRLVRDPLRTFRSGRSDGGEAGAD
ncbi:LytR/AlgR family response regulator transcription factor [Gordonia phthalatica]|uniref:LytR family transcriptional regulator n=1 Tax=Gordonia phthalatica TaxID=1136941 RepID=A0A0N9N8X5_9ACTN|nr:LytTR family DNA-binding domain-containing protein [Gordonia phthalatica]ALG83579.1 LytR family transcriptional regulator [Gordonia phthalatica]